MKRNDNKRQAFIREYLKDQNGTQAAIRAGYSKHTAREQAARLLSKVHIQDAIRERLKGLEDKVLVTKEYVVRGFKEVADRCRQAEPVMEFDHESKEMVQKKVFAEDPKTGEGKWVGVYKFDSSGANKALECLGKHLGIFIEKHEHSGPNGGPIRLADLVQASIDVEKEAGLNGESRHHD